MSFYRDLTSTETRKPVGTTSPVNWHRYADPAFDVLLEAFPRTPEGPEQQKIIHELQREFSKQLPAIPLFPNPSWGTYSTRYFTGFQTRTRLTRPIPGVPLNADARIALYSIAKLR